MPVIFEHARLVFVSFKRDSSARLCSDVLTNVARTFFTSCIQVHCSFLFSGIIRFLMQELLALVGLSRCRVWKVTVEEFYSWQRLHSFSFQNRFLDMNRFLVFLGNPKSCKGSLLVHICSASTQALNVFKHSRLQIPWVWLKSNVGDRNSNGIKLQVSRA